MQQRARLISDRLQARREFAANLRALRTARGFATARSLAKALGIDENRYTRYERAEVEPDLALIRRICKILNLAPNELLGTAVAATVSDSAEANAAPALPAKPETSSDLLAWKLSCLVASAMPHEEGPQTVDASTPLAPLKRAIEVMEEIAASPLAAFSRILRNPWVETLEPSVAQQIHDLIVRLTDALSGGATDRAG